MPGKFGAFLHLLLIILVTAFQSQIGHCQQLHNNNELVTTENNQYYSRQKIPSSFFKTIVDDWLTTLLLKFVDLAREGLVEAGADNIPMPDCDWTLSAGLVTAKFHMKENKLEGLTDFLLHNMSLSLTQLKLGMDVEIPSLEWRGIFTLGGTALGLPLSGSGPFSLKFESIKVSGDGQLRLKFMRPADPVSILIYDPKISFAGINLDFEGVMGGLSETEGLLVVLAIFVVYTIILAIFIVFVQRLWRKLMKRRRKNST